MVLDGHLPVTWLFVPADRPERFDKAAASGADCIVLDLEDAVLPESRASALDHCVDWLQSGGRAWVRASAPAAPLRLPDEIARIRRSGGLQGLILPKCSGPEEVETASEEAGAPVVALIESAEGVANLDHIARAEGLAGLAFGELDFIEDSGISDPEALRVVRIQLTLAARSRGLPPPIDGVTTSFTDDAAVTRDARAARGLGFGGKLCIHPRQIRPILLGFAPTPEELHRARSVLETAGSGRGATALAGSMVDAPVIERARQVVAAASRAQAGLTSSPASPQEDSASPLLQKVVGAFAGLPAGWKELIDRDPEFVSAFTAFISPGHGDSKLPARVRCLLSMAIAAAPTTLDPGAVERHMARAFEEGATEREVLDVVELVSLLGIHSLAAGLPLIERVDGTPTTEAAAHPETGYWAAFERHFPGFDASLRTRLPGVDAGYRALNRAVWRPDGLHPRWRELVFVVADLATTHLFTTGAALHIENAMHYGASPAEIAEAVALTLAIGGRSIELALPAFAAASQSRKVDFKDDNPD